MKMAMVLAAVALLAATGFANDLAEMKAKIGQDRKIISVDRFHGFDRVVFDFEGYEAWVVCPAGGTREGRPWTWCMQWATAFVPRTNVPQMLRDGYHHVTINTFSHRMDETGLKISAAFQDFLVDRLGFAKKAYLIGMSWGGFFSVRYASRYPQNVAKMYLDAPLLCFKDFRVGIGPWADKMPADGWAVSPEMPLNMAESIAKADIPVLVLYGGVDAVVPPPANCEPFMARFRAAGGDLTVTKRGFYAHHPHGVEVDENVIKDFFERPKQLPVLDVPGDASFPVRDGRLESPKVRLDKTAEENAFYRLTFGAKGAADGCWRVDLEDGSGRPLSGVDGCIAASADGAVRSVLVPTVPDAVQATVSFFSHEDIAVRDVRLIRISVAEANEMVQANYAKAAPLSVVATAKDWTSLPNARVAIKVAKDFNIVFLGGSTLNDAWCGGVQAPLALEYPDTVFHSYLSVCDADGCQCGCSTKCFEENVASRKPNLVVIGDVPRGDASLSETVRRCKAAGAEVVVCAKPGVAPADVQTWDLSCASNRIQRAMMMFRYFNAAQK